MSRTIRVYDPTGHARVERIAPAPLPPSLDGLRPGIVENRKANAGLLMRRMVEGLRERFALGALTAIGKPSAGPSTAGNVRRLAEGADFALVGSSD